MVSENKHHCIIKNCTQRPTRCANYTFYCRNHFMKFIIAHRIISKNLKKAITYKKIIKNN
jgi:hypothetical protein